MALDRETILLEEYKALRSQILADMTGLSNIFNYGLVTLGISFTAIQAIFNQINEILKSSSTANIDQLNFLVTVLWILLILFVPFICIAFPFKWLSNARSIAITGCWIAEKIEMVTPSLSWESELRRLRRDNHNPFLKYGGFHPFIVLLFFLSIGFISQAIYWMNIEAIPQLHKIAFIIFIIYICFIIFSLRELVIVSRILQLLQFANVPSITSPEIELIKQVDAIIVRISNVTNVKLSLRTLKTLIRAIVIIVVCCIILLIGTQIWSQILNLWSHANKINGIINPIEITQQKIVSTYVEDINSLINSEPTKEKLSIARGLTLKTIKSLDKLKEKDQNVSNNGKSEIISFLYDVGLIGSLEASSTENNGINCQKDKDKNLYLRRVNLENGNLALNNLQCINLKGASLQNANLSEAVLSGADLSYAILKESNLSKAILAGADLTGAHLENADLTGANLKDVKNANLKGAKNVNSKGVKNTNLPYYYKR